MKRATWLIVGFVFVFFGVFVILTDQTPFSVKKLHYVSFSSGRERIQQKTFGLTRSSSEFSGPLSVFLTNPPGTDLSENYILFSTTYVGGATRTSGPCATVYVLGRSLAISRCFDFIEPSEHARIAEMIRNCDASALEAFFGAVLDRLPKVDPR